jgi:hypothetical protein
MPTTPSAKTKSPRGSSGRDDNSPVDSEVYQETTATDPDCESPDTQVPVPASVSEPVGAVAADDCGNDQTPHVPATPILSESDRKLATRMTKAIADQLGLSGRTRSVRV